MSRVPSKDTGPEILVREFLLSRGLCIRKNVRGLPGSPDIVVPAHRTVVFVHGCFWHGHEDCSDAALPKTNRIFWKRKIAANKTRDQRNMERLEEGNWGAIIVWQCEINSINRRQQRLEILMEEITRPRQ